MDTIRAKKAVNKVGKAPAKKQVVQKTRTLKQVAEQKPRKKQQVVQRRHNSGTDVRDEPPPRRDDGDFLTKALIFGTGIAVGGALKN